MKGKYSFGFYPNFACFNGSWDNGNLSSKYPEEFAKIKSFDFKTSKQVRSLIAFPGFEEQLEIENYNDSLKQHGKNPPMIILTPKLFDYGMSHSESRDFIDSSSELNFDDDSIPAADYVRHSIAKLAKSMIESTYYWDEEFLFRFYVLNEFCADSISLETTFGSFIESNMEQLYNGFRTGDSKMNSSTKELLKHYDQNNALLHHSEDLWEVVRILTKDEVVKVIKRGKGFFPSNLEFEKDFVKEITLDTIRQDKRCVSFAELDVKVLELFNRILDFYEIDYNSINPEISEIFQAGQLMNGTFALIYNYEIYEYLKHLDKVFYEIEPINLMPMLFNIDSVNIFMGYSDMAFSYIRRDLRFGKMGKLMNILFENERFPNDVIVDFMNQALMEHDGCVPEYEEWMKFIEDEGTFNRLIPFSILLPMITENNNDTNRDMEYIKKYRIYMNELKKIINDKANDQVVVLSADEETQRMKKIFNKSDKHWSFDTV